MKEKKKTYYNIYSSQADNFWLCTEKQLKAEIIDWLADDDTITIKSVKMTEAEFAALPEYGG
jgi:hypothetical protein